MKTKTLTFKQLTSIIRESLWDMDSSSVQQEARELYLYIVNDTNLYHRFTQPIIANLQKKYRKGVYDRDLALKSWQRLADEGNRQYVKEFEYDVEEGSPVNFDKPARVEAAKELRDHYEERVMVEDW